MGQSVDARRSRQGGGHAHHEHGVIQRQVGQTVGVHHEHFGLGILVGDHIGAGTFGAGACRGVDGNDRRAVLLGLVHAVVILNPAAVGRENAHGLCHVDGGAAADGDQRAAATLGVKIQSLVDDLCRWIRFDAVKDHVFNVGIVQDCGDFPGGADLHQTLVGDDQDFLCAQALEKVGNHRDAVPSDQGVARLIEFNHSYIFHSAVLRFKTLKIAQNLSNNIIALIFPQNGFNVNKSVCVFQTFSRFYNFCH